MAMGYTINLPEEDRYMVFSNELRDRMAQALAGRAAEELVFDDITTGAANDLERVSQVARQMVTEYGMSAELGPITYGRKNGAVFLGKELAEERNYSEEAARKIDQEVRRLVDEAYQRATEIIQEHRDKLQVLVEALLEYESLTMEQVESLLEHGELPREEKQPEAEEAVESAEPETESAETEPASGVVPERPLPEIS